MNTIDPRNAKQDPAGDLPVFVDDSGRKLRNMKRIGYASAVLGIGFLGMVGVGLATEDVGPSPIQAGAIPAPFVLPPAAVGKVMVKVPLPAETRPAPARRVVPPPPVTSTRAQPPTTTTTAPAQPAPVNQNDNRNPNENVNENPNPNPNPNPGQGEGAGQPVPQN